MQIIKNKKYLNELQNVMLYIAKDSVNRAIAFEQHLDEKIKSLPDMPYRCRQSIYFEDQATRDLIFKGYVIVYKVDAANDRIIIIGIIKYRAGV